MLYAGMDSIEHSLQHECYTYWTRLVQWPICYIHQQPRD